MGSLFPCVTDEQLEKVIQAAASPVFVLFEEIDSLGWRNNRQAVHALMPTYDDKIIFIRLLIDENPKSALFNGPLDGDRSRSTTFGAVGFVRGRRIGEIPGIFSFDRAQAFCEQLLARTVIGGFGQSET